jgi:hypothetical protein
MPWIAATAGKTNAAAKQAFIANVSLLQTTHVVIRT